MQNPSGDLPQEEPQFDWMNAEWAPLYPELEIVAEVGRITVAAARVDRQLCLLLHALKYDEELGSLLRRQSSELCRLLLRRLRELFEGDLLLWAEKNLAETGRRLEARHAVAHSIWTAADRSELLCVELLNNLRGQADLDKLLLECGAAAQWKTIHPKTGGPGPQTGEELAKARRSLEEAETWLEGARFTLASALFAGKPAGARQVLNSQDFG
jgi:hypothetical protein